MATLIAYGDVITMNPTRDVLRGGAVLVDGTAIAEIGRTSDLLARFPGATVVDASGCLVAPGFVNAHQHLTGDPLVRCCIPDRITPDEAIYSWAVPLHQHHSAADDEMSALLCSVENVLNGVTTVVEAGTVAHPEHVAAAMEAVGLRGTIATWGWDAPGVPFGGSVDDQLARAERLVRRYPSGGQIEAWVALVGHDLVSDALFTGAAALARASRTRLTFHMSPTSADAESYTARTGRRPLVHLQRLGVLGPETVIAHGVWLDDEEVDIVLRTGTALAYCPWAYLRLGQGVTRAGRHLEIVGRGGRVALGADSNNASDSCSILRAAALAVGLERDRRIDPLAFGAETGLELATIRGAEAIGMADRIGSIEIGKQADLVIHRMPGPIGDPALQLVWGADSRCVETVFVAGREVVRNGRCVTVDVDALWRNAPEAQQRLLDRAGMRRTSRWPETDAR